MSDSIRLLFIVEYYTLVIQKRGEKCSYISIKEFPIKKKHVRRFESDRECAIFIQLNSSDGAFERWWLY